MGGSSSKTVEKKVDHVPIQSSALGIPIPIGWGRNRITCNLLDLVNFQAHKHKEKSGKGGGSQTTISYTYTASVLLGICEGSIRGVRAIWRDASYFVDEGAVANTDLSFTQQAGIFLGKDPVSYSSTALAQAGLSLATGDVDQAPWDYLVSAFPDHAINYSGIAYAYAQDYNLSDGASVPNHSFEVDFAVQVDGLPDANPADIITDLLTNANYGLPGWSAGLLGDLSEYSSYCLANNLLLSPMLDGQQAASDCINEWLTATNSDAFFSEGVLKIRPYGDTSAVGNGAVFTPNLTPIYDLSEADFLAEDGDPPVTLNIVDQSDAYNVIQVEFLDRNNQYNTAIQPARDLANIEQYGARRQDPTTLHCICEPDIAVHSAQLLLQRSLYVREQYSFKLAWDFVLLEPMDLVTLTTTTDSLKLNRELVRIIEIEEDEDGILTLTAEGVDIGTAHAALYPSHSASSYFADKNTPPGSVSVPVMFNPPSQMTVVDHEIWLAIASTSQFWGGCEVWVSTDNINYVRVGIHTGGTRYGILTNTLPSAHDQDNVNAANVDLSESLGSLLGTSVAANTVASTLSLIGSEAISYQTATLTGLNTYALTGLRRGLYGTMAASHDPGTPFIRLDEEIFKFQYKELAVGSQFYVKLPSFNIWGGGLEDISVVDAYSFMLGSNANIEVGADVTAENAPTIRSVSGTLIYVEQDSDGNPLPGQYPISLPIARSRGSFDVSAQQTLSVGAFTGTCTSSNITVSGSTINVANPAIGKFTVTSILGNETVLSLTIEIKAHQGSADTPTSTSTFNSVNSASDVVMTSELTMVATSTSIKASAVLSFFSGHPNGSSNIKVKARISSTSGSGYSDMGGIGFVTGTAETPYVPGDPFYGGGSPGGDGSISLSQTQTGITIGQQYYIIFVGQLTDGAMAAVEETGTASIVAA